MDSNPRVSDLFTIRQAAKILNRSTYAIWYHASKHYDGSLTRGRNILLHRTDLLDLVKNHLRLKDGETTEELIQRITVAEAA
jgi:hypothetical protein